MATTMLAAARMVGGLAVSKKELIFVRHGTTEMNEWLGRPGNR